MLASLFVSLCLARTGKVRRQLEWWRKHLSGMPQVGKMSIVVTDIEGYSGVCVCVQLVAMEVSGSCYLDRRVRCSGERGVHRQLPVSPRPVFSDRCPTSSCTPLSKLFRHLSCTLAAVELQL